MADKSNLTTCWQRLGISADEIQRRELPTFLEPVKLVEVGAASSGSVHRLAPKAARGWAEMQKAASDASVEMYMISGFRSIGRQVELIEEKLKQGHRICKIVSVLAPPGCSEHHTGRAIDIGVPGFRGLDKAFENSHAFKWLQGNAQQFGFTLSFPRGNHWGYQYEPWHWCFQE